MANPIQRPLRLGRAAVSARLTLLALIVCGYVKGTFTGKTPVRSAFQTAVAGSVVDRSIA
jgi:VIT1/CCC1 family predicted Fe2+/Mn2+ transporter